MTALHPLPDAAGAIPVSARALNRMAAFNAWFSLSQTQRRLAHRYHRDALEYEARGNRRLYAECRAESDRLWRDAKWALWKARQEQETIHA